MVVEGYAYSLDDADGREILAYHWDPRRSSHVRRPHLHLGAGARLGREDLLGSHLPTGFVAVQDLLLFAIRDLGVRPLRPDWESVLEQAEPEDYT